MDTVHVLIEKKNYAIFNFSIILSGFKVILQMDPRPVIEGNKVTLQCIKRNTSNTHNTDFYKDSKFLQTLYNNSTMTIHNVSKSDEGLYNCSISGVGASPKIWLAVLTKGDFLSVTCTIQFLSR